MGREGGNREQTTGDTATQLCYTFPQQTNQKFHLFKENTVLSKHQETAAKWVRRVYVKGFRRALSCKKKLKSWLCVSMAAKIKIPCWMILLQALGWEMPLFGAPKLPFPSPVNNGHATRGKLRFASTETFRNENMTWKRETMSFLVTLSGDCSQHFSVVKWPQSTSEHSGTKEWSRGTNSAQP